MQRGVVEEGSGRVEEGEDAVDSFGKDGEM